MKDSLLDSLKDLFHDTVEEKINHELDIKISGTEQVLPVLEEEYILNKPSDKTVRIFDQYEREKLDVKCRNFILFAEQIGLVNADIREQIINQLMQSESSFVSEEELKWTLIETLDKDLNNTELNFLDFILFPEETSVQ